jgi:hypothetical protein
VPLHWPLVNAPGHMMEVLGRQELEKKRQEDGAAYLLSLPGYRPREQEQLLRDFLSAVNQLRGNGAESSSTSSSSSTGSSCAARHPDLGHNNDTGSSSSTSSSSSSRAARLCSTSPEAGYGLSRFYMWGQTPAALLIAVYLPTGGSQRQQQPADTVEQAAVAPPLANTFTSHSSSCRYFIVHAVHLSVQQERARVLAHMHACMHQPCSC